LTRIVVTLTDDEDRFARGVARDRQSQNLKQGNHDRFGADPENGWTLHIRGCLGEMAVAKHLGLPWNGNLGNYRAHDVGPYEVRTAQPGLHRRLILHDRDHDDRPYIHVISDHAGRYHLIGWLYGREGKRREWWIDPSRAGRHAYFVPNASLRPMNTLPHVTAVQDAAHA
jgi:hypothetical protein